MRGISMKQAWFFWGASMVLLLVLALWQLFFPALGSFLRWEATSFGVLCQVLEFWGLWGGLTLLLGSFLEMIKDDEGKEEGSSKEELEKKGVRGDLSFSRGIFWVSLGLVFIGGVLIFAGQGLGVSGWGMPYCLAWGILFSWTLLGVFCPRYPRGLICVLLGGVLGLLSLESLGLSAFYKALALEVAQGGLLLGGILLGGLFLGGKLWRGGWLKILGGWGIELGSCFLLLLLFGWQVILPQEEEKEITKSARESLAQKPASLTEKGSPLFVVENAPLDKRGEEIYSQLGCVLCHTQEVSQGTVWRLGWSASEKEGAREIRPRVSLVEDYEGSYVAPVGRRTSFFLPRGGELTYLAVEIENKLLSEDAEGKPVAYGRVEEWLALFLYAPRDPQWGNPRSLCPPCPFLFEEKAQYSLLPNERALPLKTRAGVQIVPTEKGRLLIAYLASLKKEGRLSPLSQERWALRGKTEADLWLAPPASLASRVDETQVFARLGSKVFSSQCSVCHGADGTGDGQNYPPLKGSEWVNLPSPVLAELILRGLRGPLVVAGKNWDNYMTAHRGRLTNKEVAAVIAYVEKTFGSAHESRMSLEQVEAVRQRVFSLGPMSPQELEEKRTKN